MKDTEQHLEILGLPPNTSRQEIEEVHANMARLWHPDRFQGKDSTLQHKAKEKFAEIENAYQALLTFIDNQPKGSDQESIRADTPKELIQNGNKIFAGKDKRGGSIFFDKTSVIVQQKKVDIRIEIYPPESNKDFFQDTPGISEHEQFTCEILDCAVDFVHRTYALYCKSYGTKDADIIVISQFANPGWRRIESETMWSIGPGSYFTESESMRLVVRDILESMIPEVKQKQSDTVDVKQKQEWQALKAKLELEAQQKVAESKDVHKPSDPVIAQEVSQSPPISEMGTGLHDTVAQEQQYAGFWLRVAATFVDSAITFLPALIIAMFAVGVAGQIGGFVISAVMWWLYQALMESSDFQASFGKRVAGIIVTDYKGKKISFAQATGRHFGKSISAPFTLGIGFLMVAFTDKNQALHDKMASTYVVRREGINRMALVANLSFTLYVLIAVPLWLYCYPAHNWVTLYASYIVYSLIPLIPLIIFNLTKQRHRGLGITCVAVTAFFMVFTIIGTIGKVKADDQLAGELVEEAYSFEQAGQYSEALKAISKAIELRPRAYYWYGYRSKYHSFLGNFDKAIADNNRAIGLQPNYWEAHVMLGMLHSLVGDYNQSIGSYTRAIELRPSDAYSYYMRGRSHFKVGNHDAGYDDIQKAALMGDEDAKKMLSSH